MEMEQLMSKECISWDALPHLQEQNIDVCVLTCTHCDDPRLTLTAVLKMQQQHQYVMSDWALPQHPHTPAGTSPALHLWANHVPAGTRIPGSKVNSNGGDPSGRLGAKNAVLQQSVNLQVQSQNGESMSSEQNENSHAPRDILKMRSEDTGSSSNPASASDLQRLLIGHSQTGCDPRMQTYMPYYPLYNNTVWNPDELVPPLHVSGVLNPGRSSTYDHSLPAVNGELQHHITSFLTNDNGGVFNGLNSGGLHQSTSIHPPVTDLRTLQAVLREAKPGSGQVAEALLQVAFPLRLPGLTAIMGRFTKSGQWAISLDIFDTLPALALPRDTTVCNAALAACMRGCLWQRAKQTFDLMITQGVPLDNITYYTMLSVPRRRKLWRVTMDLFLHMCQAHVQPVLPDVAGMLSEISQDGKWPLSEKLFNYVFRQVPVLTGPQHIDSTIMKDMNASDLQIVRMLNNALRQSSSTHLHSCANGNIPLRNGDSQGPYRIFQENSAMNHSSSHQGITNCMNGVPSCPASSSNLIQSCGSELNVDDITSSMSGLSFKRPSSSSDNAQLPIGVDSRHNGTDSRQSWQDPALESILQQAAAVAARECNHTPASPELACCNELLSVYLRCGLQQRAAELLKRMIMYVFPMDLVSTHLGTWSKESLMSCSVGGVFSPGIETCHRFLTMMY